MIRVVDLPMNVLVETFELPNYCFKPYTSLLFVLIMNYDIGSKAGKLRNVEFKIIL